MDWRIRSSALVVASLLLAGFATPTADMSARATETVIEEAHPDRVLVRVGEGTAAGVLPADAIHLFGGWYESPTLSGETATDAMQRLRSEPYVEIVELDRRVRLEPMAGDGIGDIGIESVTPNDPGYGLQWHLPAIEAPDAWETTSGAGVVVAVVDTGISMGGEDLDCRPLAGEFNAITNVAAPGSATDDVRHGTHVAGTIGQCTDNGRGVAGVAGETSLLAIKVLDEDGGWDSDVAQGIDWARTNGADVINLSLSGSCAPPSAIITEAVDDAVAADIVVVASTGNDADETGYSGEIGSPACHPDVIAVGATDLNDNVSYYSNWGTSIDVTAPGGDNRYDLNSDGYADGVLQETFDSADPSHWLYVFLQGTSMAAPHVSGTAALLLAANPSASADQVKAALEMTATDRGSPGWDAYYGHGLIDAEEALDAILDSSAPSWPSGAGVDVAAGDTYADLSWDAATDNFAVTQYKVWLDGSPVTTSTTTSVRLTGLAADTTYSVAVQAGDLMNNWSSVGSATTFETDPLTVDLEAPTWAGGTTLDAEIISDQWVWLEWEAASDNIGVTGYRIIQDGVVALTTPDTYVTVENLTEGTSYVFGVEAGDAYGNWSTTGPVTTVTTEDWTLPSWASNASLEAEDVFEDAATLRWTAAADPSGIAEYRIWIDFRYYSTSGARSLTVTGLQPSTEYLAWVEAEDPNGNWSMGPDLLFTTATDFADTNGSIFATDIAWLAGSGITKGCNPPHNTMYCPDSFVTRAQMAAFMVRAFGYSDDGGGDLFSDDDGSVFEGDIDRLAAAGVTRGCNPPLNTRFCPNDRVSRGQMAAFLHRALGG